jgi:hypothetical protein
LVSNPTRTFGSVCRGSLRNTLSSVAGFNFAAQPAALAIDVSFTGVAKDSPRCHGNHYNDAACIATVTQSMDERDSAAPSKSEGCGEKLRRSSERAFIPGCLGTSG